MRPLFISLVSIVTLMAMVLPTAAWGDHETSDERSPTPFPDFHESVRSLIDPWLSISETSIANDHAVWRGYSLYELLLRIRPEPCYLDTYAAYWAVAVDLREMGEAPSLDLQEAAFERTLEALARAEALASVDESAELDEGGCLSAQTDAVDEPDQQASASQRVIEIEATGSLQYTDEQGDRLTRITVNPGESVLFRLHNAAGFEHSFYIGTEQELAVPIGVTDTGIETWTGGVRELEWTAPIDVSGLMFGCTVPGHFATMHGILG